MPRSARIDAPGVLHHVIVRGIEQRRIFRCDRDYDDFIGRLERLLPETHTPCFAWALMPNHVHLLLRSGPDGLSGVMRRLLTGYAVSFNRRHRRHGTLFQNRFKSILCQEDAYLKELVRYLHLNPLRAGLVDSVGALKGFPFCGHGALLGARTRKWQDTRYVLGQFAATTRMARSRYLAFVEKGADQGRREDLTGGGLIRSLGGWAEVKRLRRREMGRLKGDERILGDPGFVQEVLDQARERMDRRYALSSQGWTPDRAARKAASLYGISPEKMLRRGRQKDRMEARSLYCYWCSHELGLSLTDIARSLGMTPSGVGYAVRRGESIAIEKGFRLAEGDRE